MMQIVRTEVAETTIGNGETGTRVTFRGEGGESIVVETAGKPEADESAIERAKALLIQTGVFWKPASPETHTDPIGAMERLDRGGRWYIFEYRDGESSRRVPPSILPGPETAREEALRSAVDLLPEIHPAMSSSAWLVRVYDESDALLLTVTRRDAETASGTRG